MRKNTLYPGPIHSLRRAIGWNMVLSVVGIILGAAGIALALFN